MTGFRPEFWPTLFTLPVLLVCLALGSWQVHRLSWKERLVAQREAGALAAPVPVPQDPAAARKLEYHRVRDHGRFLNSREIYVQAVSDFGPAIGETGFRVLTPLVEASGRIVFVDRGFVPAALRDPSTRPSGEIAGTGNVEGFLRLPPAGRPGWFRPNNRPDINYWFWIDLKAMAAADHLDHVAPFYIQADAAPNRGGWPQGSDRLPQLPNNHLEYALTWFSLAVVAIVFYVLHHRRNFRPR